MISENRNGYCVEVVDQRRLYVDNISVGNSPLIEYLLSCCIEESIVRSVRKCQQREEENQEKQSEEKPSSSRELNSIGFPE